MWYMSEIWGWESKSDFIDWCREKALEVLKYGDRDEAFENFVYNVEKHPDYAQSVLTILDKK